MREIKYRIPWYNAAGVFQGFTYWGRIDNKEAPSSDCFTSPGQWGDRRAKPDEQFTGLRDKNGAKIYEGDILLSHITKYRYVVTFDIDRGWFMANRPRSYFATYNWEQGEVIGNIHENPEILKGAN